MQRWQALAIAIFTPIRWLERLVGAERAVSVDDVASIIFSSGSTGDPKGVLLTHFNVDSNLAAIAQIFRCYPDDRVIDVLPPFHSFGYLVMWMALNRGMGSSVGPNPLDGAGVGAMVQKYAATVILATPTFLQIYLRRTPPAAFGSPASWLPGAGEAARSRSCGRSRMAVRIRPLEGWHDRSVHP
ncbi:MAG: AMP-binding protein [Isosphaeraceae bacterium]